MSMHHIALVIALSLFGSAVACAQSLTPRPTYAQPGRAAVPVTLPLVPNPAETVVLVGNRLGEGMLFSGYFETALQRRFPDLRLTVRNLCYPGDTAGLRPRAGAVSQWAFPGAERFHPATQAHFGKGHYPTPDEWLVEVKASIIIAFFGFNESFEGVEGIPRFKAEVSAWIDHSQSLVYDGQRPPRIVLVTPIAFEDRSNTYALPNGVAENKRLALYAQALVEVAQEKQVAVVDLFGPTQEMFRAATEPLTVNGCHLSDEGHRQLAPLLAAAIFGGRKGEPVARTDRLLQAVKDKDWFWLNDHRILNGVHVYGERWSPYGNVNYPEEIAKLREMTKLRDEAIWDIMGDGRGIVDDGRTRKLTPIETNFPFNATYLAPPEALDRFKLPEGYKISLFASENEFPFLQKPMQMSFDNRGRLWVAVSPSYPHYRPGDPRPNDKILILEDTDGDGRADRQTVYADGLHIPMGMHLAPEGLYLAQQPNLLLLRDVDGDDRADRTEILLGGFDTHDTHHAIHAFEGDPSGAFYMNEGRFLHSQVETPYGPVRCTDGGIWRFDPRSWRLERFSQTDYNNPWGIAFDRWGQPFVADASGGDNYWLLPLSVRVPHGREIQKEGQFTTHRVRPTAGAEFVHTRHFPESVQGDFVVNNTIGFLGTKQHTVIEDGSGGYEGALRQDLLVSSDPNFRPVDLEFAPDGSLYIVDWHNALVGHMQHSARDPNRDTDRGRIYRITYPSRPLVQPPAIADAPIDVLLENLKLPELRARYRTHRELRGRPAEEVLPAVIRWAGRLNRDEAEFESHLLEALWVTWGQGRVDPDLMARCLRASKPEVRAAAVQVLRYARLDASVTRSLLLLAAQDSHPRVRLASIVASSWVEPAIGGRVLIEAMKKPVGKWMGHSLDAALWTLKDAVHEIAAKEAELVADNPTARDYLAGKVAFAPKAEAIRPPTADTPAIPRTNLPLEALALFDIGKKVYSRDGSCATCHQANGRGLPDTYPSIAGPTEWVSGSDERLISLVLKGLWGPLELNGRVFGENKNVPPMMGFDAMLTDEEIAGVLTFIRNSWRNSGPPISPEAVRKVREATKDRKNFYMVDELLRQYPLAAPGK